MNGNPEAERAEHERDAWRTEALVALDRLNDDAECTRRIEAVVQAERDWIEAAMLRLPGKGSLDEGEYWPEWIARAAVLAIVRGERP